MNPSFWNFDLGDVGTIAGVLIAYLALRNDKREEEDKKHKENLEQLIEIKMALENVKHLDECVDELKKQFNEFHQMFLKFIGRRRG